jgi:glyoxylase-like metal-dependent hydrolase (beta-lactamase superfamily II)
MRRLLQILTLAGVAALPAKAQTPDYSKVEETIADLGHGMYVVHGLVGVGNTTVAVGKKSIIVVDTQFGAMHDKIVEKIRTVSKLPIKYVIVTHFHGDHADGTPQFHTQDGATIVASAATADLMKNRPLHSEDGPTTPADGMPTITFSGARSVVKIPGKTAVLYHLPPAHTSGDTVVIWPQENIISTGDLVALFGYPLFDTTAGGNIDGMIAASQWLLDHSNAKTRFIVGHGPLWGGTTFTKPTIQAYHDMLVTTRARIAKAKADGMTEQQVSDSKTLLADFDGRWKPPHRPNSARYPGNVYRSIP